MMNNKILRLIVSLLLLPSCVISFAPPVVNTLTSTSSVDSKMTLSSALFARTTDESAVANTKKVLAAASLGMMALMFGGGDIGGNSNNFMAPPPAHAESARVVGEIKGSGLVFKDTLQIESFPDPKVQGVTLYISNFQKPITERLGSGMFNDPSSASVACAKTGPVKVADTINKSKGGEEVFQESKSILFKSLRVQRVYDEETQTVVYVTFNTRLDKSDDSNKSRFTSGLCAVNLDNSGPASSAPSPPATP